MRILAISDEPSSKLWGDLCRQALSGIDLILSAGDLPAPYLSFLTCFTSAPVVYVHGNHDDKYAQQPPEGCLCADGKIIMVKGVRILGLGGCVRYRPDGVNMYTEKEMASVIRSLRGKLRAAGGFDILLTHAPVRGLGDQDDLCHRGFECFGPLLDEYHPAVMVHGNIHQSYGALKFQRERSWNGIPVINACGCYTYEWPDEWRIEKPPRPLAARRMKKRSEPGEEHF
jgi:predicted phosphodiesterase